MKTYITLFTLLLFNFVSAQQLPVLSTTQLSNADNDMNYGANGNYAMDTANERDQYVGTWEYNQNGTLFQVKIEKKDMDMNQITGSGVPGVDFYNYTDVVTFKYKLVKNGVTIYNNLNTTYTENSTYFPAIQSGGDNYLYGRFLDYTRNVAGIVTVTKLNTTNPEKIIFNISLTGNYKRNPDTYYDDGQPLFTVPTGEIEMVKIN
ncbi:hypothetical protein E0W68_11475 [Flavobacterium salilacus subsp. salilacus]|uniref:DUF6705 family protein n=1 Tax=Flavobacterium TaxID=237 RepID=UPI0010756101|nr:MULTISPECIES: DUF6705 family protein [Flavobacterium]KAF2516828.1 hypothetical protein E0W68_11475 [Flavobacterium salilacus subsp. salilacus]MBE1615813.1 hypothetical protein [Flavobacterium sp. SaA2.13]